MFTLVVVGAAGVIDGFAAGLYIGHRWAKGTLIKKAVDAAEKAIVEELEETKEVINEVEKVVAPAPAVAPKPLSNLAAVAAARKAQIDATVAAGKPK